jgi:hypothetical protein
MESKCPIQSLTEIDTSRSAILDASSPEAFEMASV